MDFVDLKKVVNEKVVSKLDHTDLNDFFKNPSAENIVIWIWGQLKNIGKEASAHVTLTQVQLWEGDNTSVTYEGR